MVVKRGVNDDSIVPMARAFHGTGHTLRFIEYMDVGSTNGWRLDDVVSAAEILDAVGTAFPLEPVDPGYRGEVARRWRYVDGGGEIGIIASVTKPFCASAATAPAHDSPPRAGSTRASSALAATTCARSFAAAPRTTISPTRSRRSGGREATVTRSCGPRKRPGCRGSR
jgi:hypothetical protein